jgi:hypothetical protein
MPLQPLHLRGTDSIEQFEAAAPQRLAEAERLSKRSHHLGAIYLYGYSVEMRVKAIYFRNAGFALHQVITREDRNHAANMYGTLGLLVRPGQHDIANWAILAVAARATTPAPYPIGIGSIATEFANRAAAINLIWRETLRYRSSVPLGNEIREVRQIAHWFASLYARMI